MDRILVCDDDEAMRELIVRYLRKEGYAADEAADGQLSLQKALTGDYKLILLDVMMPFMDGIEILRRVRERYTVPVIFLTARDNELDKVLGLGLGADDYITKPFSLAELGARIRAALRRTYYYDDAPPSDPLLQSGDVILQLDSCRVMVAGQEVELTAKEYEILKYFLSNPGRVLTKRQIFQQVWGDSYLEDDNTVMVHISRLRNKLEGDPQKPRYIKTIRGIGYKLERD